MSSLFIEKPLSFCNHPLETRMISSLLSGEKTVIRQVVRDQPRPDRRHKMDLVALPSGSFQWVNPGKTCREWYGMEGNGLSGRCLTGLEASGNWKGFRWFGKMGISSEIECPLGNVGARLWFRERWKGLHTDEGVRVEYLDGNVVVYQLGGLPKADDWRLAVTMPRFCSRATIEIQHITVHRLSDVTLEGLQAEGYESIDEAVWSWEKLFGKEVTHMDPWVWAVTVSKVNLKRAAR
jgi:hypothetical protein